MSRKFPVVSLVLLLVGSGTAAAEPLKFGFRFVQRGDRSIQITAVEAKGLADQIGLRQDDIVKKVNGKNIGSKSDLDEALKAVSDSKTYEIVVFRPRQKKDVSLNGKIIEGASGTKSIISRP